MIKKEWDGERFLIAQVQLGFRIVDVYANPKIIGGSCNLCSGMKPPTIEVGMDYGHIEYPHGVLTHEAMEMCMMDQGTAYKPLVFESTASDLHFFAFNHNQFTELASRVSYFLFMIDEPFKSAWKKCQQWRKKQKK